MTDGASDGATARGFLGVSIWHLRAVLIAFMIILCTTPPTARWFDMAHAEVVQEQIDAPWGAWPEQSDPSSHAAKLVLRRTVPLMAAGLGISAVQTCWINLYFGILLYLSAATIFRRQLSAGWATAMVAGLALTFAGKMVATDEGCFYDVVALGLLFAAMASRRPWLVAAAIFLAGWTDERGLAASSFVALYLGWPTMRDGLAGPAGRTLRQPAVLACFVGWGLYFASRWAAGHWLGWHSSTDGTGLSYLWSALPVAPLTVWSSLEGFWLVALVGVGYLWRREGRLLAAGLVVATLAVLGLTVLVLDHSRSAAYLAAGLPVFLVAFGAACRGRRRELWLRATFIVCILSPALFIQAPNTIRLAAETPAPLVWSEWFE